MITILLFDGVTVKTGRLSDELENACLISMQVRPDGFNPSKIKKDCDSCVITSLMERKLWKFRLNIIFISFILSAYDYVYALRKVGKHLLVVRFTHGGTEYATSNVSPNITDVESNDSRVNKLTGISSKLLLSARLSLLHGRTTK